MPWGHRWNVLAACVLFQAFTIGVLVYCFTLLVSPFVTEFNADRAPVVILATLSGLAFAFLAPAVGWASDRLSMRIIVAAGLVLFVAGLLLLSVTTALWQVWVLYATVLPLGATLAGPVVAQTLVTRWFTERRGLALGISSAGTSLGGFVLPPTLALLIGAMGWRGSLAMFAGLGLILVVPLVLLVLRRQENDGLGKAKVATASLATTASGVPIVRRRIFWILVMSIAPMAFVFSSLQHNIGPLAMDHEIGRLTLAYATSLFAASMVFGKLAFGALSDRVDCRYLLWVCAALLLASVVALTRGPHVTGLYLGSFFLGLSGGGFLPLVSALCVQKFHETEFGRAFGACFFFTNITMLGPYLTAQLRDVTGSYVVAMQVLLVLLVPALTAAYFIGRRPTAPLSIP